MWEALEHERERKSLEELGRGPRAMTISAVVFGACSVYAVAVDFSHVVGGYHYPLSLFLVACFLMTLLQIRVWRAARTLAAAISRIEARLAKLEEQGAKGPSNTG